MDICIINRNNNTSDLRGAAAAAGSGERPGQEGERWSARVPRGAHPPGQGKGRRAEWARGGERGARD